MHPYLNGVPRAKRFRQPAPFTALLRDLKQRLEQLLLADANSPSLPWQAILEPLKLTFADLHTHKNTTLKPVVN
jgi:hypothetical protein